MSDKQSQDIITDLFKEVRSEAIKETEKPPKKKEFKKLPEGDYIGKVYIVTNVVTTPKSVNHGLKKYEIRLTVSRGEQIGKMAYYHRIILPSYLSIPPKNAEKHKKWKADVKNYFRTTDKILAKCGVDISDTDMDHFTKKIAENNRRKREVHFTVKGNDLYINYPIEKNVEDEEESLLRKETEEIGLPDGNDLPLG